MALKLLIILSFVFVGLDGYAQSFYRNKKSTHYKAIKKGAKRVKHACKTGQYSPKKAKIHKSHDEEQEEGGDDTPPQTLIPPPPEICEPCEEEIVTLFNKFYPANFDEGQADLSEEDAEEVVKEIKDYIESNSDSEVTDINLVSSASRTRWYQANGQLYDQATSDVKNLELADKRAAAAIEILMKTQLKESDSDELVINPMSRMSGPDFHESDLALRKIKMGTPDYEKHISEIWDNENESKLYKQEALIEDEQEHVNRKFKNFYDAKFKPFQGFLLEIKGYKKSTKKCDDN